MWNKVLFKGRLDNVIMLGVWVAIISHRFRLIPFSTALGKDFIKNPFALFIISYGFLYQSKNLFLMNAFVWISRSRSHMATAEDSFLLISVNNYFLNNLRICDFSILYHSICRWAKNDFSEPSVGETFHLLFVGTCFWRIISIYLYF